MPPGDVSAPSDPMAAAGSSGLPPEDRPDMFMPGMTPPGGAPMPQVPVGRFQLPPPQFPPPESLRFLLAAAQQQPGHSAADPGTHHLRLASFLAKLPRTSAEKGPQPPQSRPEIVPSALPPPVPANMFRSPSPRPPFPPRMMMRSGGAPFGSAVGPPPGFPASFGAPPLGSRMRPPRLPVSGVGSLAFPPPMAPPKRLMELDTKVPRFIVPGIPEPKRPRFLPPMQGRKHKQHQKSECHKGACDPVVVES